MTTDPIALPPKPVTTYVIGVQSDGYSDDRLHDRAAYDDDQLDAYAREAVHLDREHDKPLKAPAKTLTQRLQQKCSDWKTYWRAPDAHGVNLSIEQATELLADALGVEVAIAEPVPISDADLDATISEIDSIAHNWYGGGLPDDPESVVAIRAVLRLLAEKGKPPCA